MKLDDFDFKIIKEFQIDAHQTNLALAEKIALRTYKTNGSLPVR